MRKLEKAVPGVPYKRHDLLGEGRRVLGILNSGGMGVVYLVSMEGTGELRAIKTYHDRFIRDGQVRERFLEEARMWSGFGGHRFIIRLLGVFTYEGRPYIEMEYVAPDLQGEVTLRDQVGKSLSVRRIVRWGIQFCLGMEHAHARGLTCHCDVKPENLMVGPCLVMAEGEGGGMAPTRRTDLQRIREAVMLNEVSQSTWGWNSEYRFEDVILSTGLRVIKVSDFGLSKGLDALAVSNTHENMMEIGQHGSLCVMRGCCGTPAYMAPEQFVPAGHIDGRADIYAFGIVLYELSVRRHPLVPKQGVSDFIQGWRASHLSQQPAEFEGPLWPIVKKCLEKDPAMRFQSVEELRSELDGLDKRIQEPWKWPYPF